MSGARQQDKPRTSEGLHDPRSLPGSTSTTTARLGRPPQTRGGENARPTPTAPSVAEERSRNANKGKSVQRLEVDHLPPPASKSKSRSRSPLTPLSLNSPLRQNLDEGGENFDEGMYRMVLQMCQNRPLFYMRWPSYWSAMLPFLARVFGYKGIDTKAQPNANTNRNLPNRKDLLAKFEATKIQLHVTRYVVKCCEPNDNYVEDDTGAKLHREFLLANLRAESKEDAQKKWEETFRKHHKEIINLVGSRSSANGY